MRSGVLPIGKMLAATAATTLPLDSDAAGMMFDTGTMPHTDVVTTCQACVGRDATLPMIDFDFTGWYNTDMPIPGTTAFVRFKRQPQVKMGTSRTVLIPEWGVSIPLGELSPERLRIAVVRQYLMLAEKARRQTLTNQERDFWRQMLADSDYGDFCQRTAPAVKDTGTRIRADHEGVEVAWSSGGNEIVPNSLAESLAIIEDGEEFSARVKFIDGKLVSLSEVVPLGKPSPVDLDDLFGAA